MSSRESVNLSYLRNTLKQNYHKYVNLITQHPTEHLIGIGGDDILARIFDYINNGINNSSQNRDASLAKSFKLSWFFDTSDNLINRQQLIHKLHIYQFFDLTYDKLYLIFADVTDIQKEHILTSLSLTSHLSLHYNHVVNNISLSRVKDLSYLFPITHSFQIDTQPYVVFTSTILTSTDLSDLFHFNYLKFPFYRLDELTGAYATLLLSETLNHSFSVSWKLNHLYIHDSSYLQCLNLHNIFLDICSYLSTQLFEFKVIPDFISCVKLCKFYNVKCLYYQYTYYCVVPKNYPDLLIPDIIVDSPDSSDLSNFGYISYTPKYNFNINLQVDTSNPNIVLFYYYSTHGEKYIVHKLYDSSNIDDIYHILNTLFKYGVFFKQYTKNILSNYPDFIPSIPPSVPTYPTYSSDFLSQVHLPPPD